MAAESAAFCRLRWVKYQSPISVPMPANPISIVALRPIIIALAPDLSWRSRSNPTRADTHFSPATAVLKGRFRLRGAIARLDGLSMAHLFDFHMKENVVVE